MGRIIGVLLASVSLVAPLNAAPANEELIAHWLAAQADLKTWAADFTQTRTLKALAAPLVSKGKVWFKAPDQFRWEIGSPPQTIAIRQPDQMLIVYPKLKRAERIPLDQTQPGPWRDLAALLEAGFPRSRADLESKFRILEVTTPQDKLAEITLEPTSAQARRIMPQIKIGFETDAYTLRYTELKFADGSTLRNDFTNATVNPVLDEKLFEAELGPDYKIVDPTRKQ